MMKPALVDDARAAQERGDAQDHLLLVDGLDEVVVCADDEPLALVGRGLLRGHHEDRDLPERPVRAQDLRELVAVHARHHDVQKDQIDVLFVQNLERLDPVRGQTVS